MHANAKLYGATEAEGDCRLVEIQIQNGMQRKRPQETKKIVEMGDACK